MAPLRKRIMEELQLRNLSRVTADTYPRALERFARYYNLSPEKLGAEKVREYLPHLMNDKRSGCQNGSTVAHCAFSMSRPRATQTPAHAARHPERP
jgi:integrase/recombinase XerD